MESLNCLRHTWRSFWDNNTYEFRIFSKSANGWRDQVLLPNVESQGTRFTFFQKQSKTLDKIYETDFRALAIRQERMVIPERWERNEVSSPVASTYSKEVFRFGCREGNPDRAQLTQSLGERVKGDQGRWRSQDRVPKRRELHRESKRSAKGLTSKCIWRDYWRLGEEHKKSWANSGWSSFSDRSSAYPYQADWKNSEFMGILGRVRKVLL